MEAITVWNESTKDLVEEGNRPWGADLALHSPYEGGLEVVYETENDDGEEWRKEFEVNVQGKIWMEEFRWGASLERRSEEFFMHKDVMTRNLSEEERTFLNPYKNRFLLIRNKGKLYIFDLETKKEYLMQKQSTFFKDFKQELKRLDLI